MGSRQRDQQGHLDVGVTSRRRIDIWTFRPGDVAGRRDPSNEIVFEVFLLKSMELTVDTKHIPKERWTELRGRVPQELHAQALAAARAEFDLKNELTWSDWLEIRVKEAGPVEGRGTQNIGLASLSYRQIPRAQTPEGVAYTVNGNGLMTRFPEPTSVCRDREGLTGNRRPSAAQHAQVLASTPENSAARLSGLLNVVDHRDADTQFSYLPDTPENRAGLDAIIAAIEGINQRLQQFLHPSEISQTLARAVAGSHRLLNGPSSDPVEPEPSPCRGPRR